MSGSRPPGSAPPARPPEGPASASLGPEGEASPCAVCGAGLEGAAGLACERCQAVVHEDCWAYAQACATYGCGGQRAVPRSQLPAQRPGGPVQIHEDTRAPIPWRLAFEAPARYLVDRSRDLPRTLPVGVAGAALTCLGIAFVAGADDFARNYDKYGLVLVAGATFGALAPFLAPLQLRRPWTLAALSGGAFLWMLTYTARTGASSQWLPFISYFALSTLCATSLCEPIFRSLRGRTGKQLRLGLRAAIAWAAGFLVWAVGVIGLDGTKALTDLDGLAFMAAFGLLSAVCGAVPMERAKDSYRAGLLPEA